MQITSRQTPDGFPRMECSSLFGTPDLSPILAASGQVWQVWLVEILPELKSPGTTAA